MHSVLQAANRVVRTLAFALAQQGRSMLRRKGGELRVSSDARLSRDHRKQRCRGLLGQPGFAAARRAPAIALPGSRGIEEARH